MRFGPSVLSVLFLAVSVSGCIAGDDTTFPSDGGDEGDQPAAASNATITWGALDTATIRPGASLGGYCTFNWVFQDALGNAYIGTAGHCTDEIGERVALGGADPETDALGTVVFDSDVSEGANALVDFALILLDDARIAETNPTMIGYDAPTGTIGPDDASAGDLVGIYGYGLLLGDTEPTRPRQGVLMSADAEQYQADMPAVPGDSGAPVLHIATGKALGIISRFNFETIPPSTDIGPTMPFIFAELEKAGYFVDVATV